ncbi:hypothetical protein FHL15_005681 [Xylaria flabelliformis]|uniref:Uncharacterized protein n=1 Tax=Xylaria flabelliformis TaxID=2512241 RepID=A0A553HZM0_9PEZI|nr:hypothetical protein FHL15_005681 [Xylaria flabelliformis]
MALGNDDNPNNGSGQNPFAYVLIPILGFGLIVAVITCYRYRRKKHRLARLAEDPEYQRQLEEGRQRTQLDRGPNGVIIIADRGGRRGGRSRRLGLGAGMGSREEGLNELGEAPPAYTPGAPKPPSELGAEHIELTTYSQATAEAGMSRSPPLYDEAPPSNAGPPSGPATGAMSGARDSARSSEEIGGDATARNATTSHAVDNARMSVDTRGDSAPITSSAGDASRTSEEMREHVPGNASASSASGSTGTNEETRGDTTTTIVTTATTATTGGTTAATSTTDELTTPPRAVLPSS